MGFLAKLIAYKVARTSVAPLSTLIAASTARGISLTGTYTGNGTSQTINCRPCLGSRLWLWSRLIPRLSAVFACSSNFLSSDYLGGDGFHGWRPSR